MVGNVSINDPNILVFDQRIDLDHTADIQIHGWAPTLPVALEQVCVAMFNYISELDPYVVDPAATTIVEVQGHDLESLIFDFLNEFLMLFCLDKMICKEVKILELDRKAFTIKAEGRGEKWTKAKHIQGTEIKVVFVFAGYIRVNHHQAITYSAMQVHETDKKADVYVIVDI